MSKGQASIELLLLLSLLLCIFIPLIFYTYTYSANLQFLGRSSYGVFFLDQLAGAILEAYYGGPGTTVFLEAEVPYGTTLEVKEMGNSTVVILNMKDGSQLSKGFPFSVRFFGRLVGIERLKVENRDGTIYVLKD